ncbi:hypothetical protein [Hydrogenophaga sp.]|uniref:hypothetical protein n=1 Tax=Hydrogenophaga sp. TaxID=1904254 RepID=UPI002FC7B80D
MPKLQKIQTSFEYGEISPRLLARIDLEAYNKATKTMENAYSLIHGGALKRPGTLFIGPVKAEAEATKLVPFVFSESIQFMLVLNGGKIQFLKDGAFVETSPGVRYELTIPYTADQLARVDFAQSGNTMYLVHPNHPPKLLQRISDTSWTLTDIPFTYLAVSDVTFSNAFISFKLINGTDKFRSGDTYTIATTAGAITTVSAITPGPGVPVSNGVLAGVISMPGSTTTEVWTITCTLSTPARQEWSVVGSGSGSPAAYWKTGNYPQTVAFFEQRLFFGGSPQFPQHIWGSCAGDYLNMTVGNRDSDGVAVQIAGNDYNAITNLVSARNLLPMTTSTEFSMAGPNNFSISGNSGNIVKDHTRNGSNFIKPLRIGREVIFLQRDGRKVRAISYSVTEDANVAPDITIFAEHLTRDHTFTGMAFAPNPDYIAWIIRSDGQMMSLTLERDFETQSWARHTTQGKFEAVGTVPAESANDVYLIVQRTVDGAVRRYVELLDYDTLDRVYSDCTAIYEGAATTVVTGLDHLEGLTVTAIVKESSETENGDVHSSRVVTDGQIEFGYPVEYAAIGLPYTTTLELLDPEFGDVASPSAGRTKSVIDVVVRFQDTTSAKINGVDVPFRNIGDLLNQPVDQYTGDKRLKHLGWTSPENIVITSDTPTPFSVLGVIIEAQVN